MIGHGWHQLLAFLAVVAAEGGKAIDALSLYVRDCGEDLPGLSVGSPASWNADEPLACVRVLCVRCASGGLERAVAAARDLTEGEGRRGGAPAFGGARPGAG